MDKRISRYFLIGFILVFGLLGCTQSEKYKPNSTKEFERTSPLFTMLFPEQTNVHFENKLTEGLNANVLVYEYLYNGGGVATGDFNDDGLVDIYFTSNMGDNKFYINRGGLKFDDVTSISKVSGRRGPWKTGISAADVNGDGKLDLYLSYSGALPPAKRKNQLFVNKGNTENGIPMFEEKAEEYGLASPAFSNQGYFLDYDRDGDLDMLLLNHNPKSLPVLNELSTKEFLKKDDPLQGVRLFNQHDGKFEDITIEAGISSSPLTYGLGLGISDVNNDGWLDFYVSNDYTIPDYLYLNQQNGTFANKLKEQMGHTSHFSMGNDIADINNDGWSDIFTLDMLPEDNRRQKLLLAPDNYEKFDLNLRSGFHYQYMRNMLQLNNGNGTFSEIGQLAGISNTDWSWAPLFADFDNDGYKDLFVTNGYFRDYTNLDFINYMDDYVKSKGRLKREDVLEIIKEMPSSNLTNYLFINQGGATFLNGTENLGLNQPANSNGAAFADLDNDGDLDLIVNNINKPAFVYRNDSEHAEKNYLQVRLHGENKNTNGIGAKVTVYTQKQSQTLEQIPVKGYLSTVSSVLHFGIGQEDLIDSLHIRWNTGKQQTLTKIRANQILQLNEKDGRQKAISSNKIVPLMKAVNSPIEFASDETPINDFKRQSLLISQLSHNGPCLAVGDINQDGLDDVFVGGVKGQPATVFLQSPDKRFFKADESTFVLDQKSHDTDAVFFDADGDGHQDIYVTSGGYHDYAQNDILLQDRLYLGDGQGNFKKNEKALPALYISNSTVAVNDINNDGFKDIYLGARVVPGRYPETPASHILINDGKGNFSMQTNNIAPEIEKLGMITDAVWSDMNEDGKKDLVVVGEWLPVSVFINIDGKLENHTEKYFDRTYHGWWNTLAVDDFNKDGKPDIIAGNMGTNTQFRVSNTTPAELYYDDFDQNGSIDPLFNYYIEGNSYPYLTRDELLGQLAGQRSRFNSYESYADAKLGDILTKDKLKNANVLKTNHMETTLFLSTEKTKFTSTTLPLQAQFAPVNAIAISDFNADGNKDMALFGNNHYFKLRLGKYDANYGTLLLGDGMGNFEYVNQTLSGLDVRDAVQNIAQLNNYLILGICGKPLKTYQISTPTREKEL